MNNEIDNAMPTFFIHMQVAARNCRKRKIDQIKQLEEDVQRIRCRKTELLQEHDQLLNERSRWSDKVKRMHDYVLKVCMYAPNAIITLDIFLANCFEFLDISQEHYQY